MYVRRVKAGYRCEVERLGVRKSAVWETKRQAEAWGARTEAEILANHGRPQHTFGEACERYIESVSPRKRSLKNESWRFDGYIRHFGEQTNLADIDSDMIGRWRDKRLETVTGSTVLRETALLRHLFSIAVDEWKWIERHPFKGVRLPAENEPRHQMWTWQLIKRVLRADRGGKTAEVQHAFRIALHTGLRLSEVLSGKYDPAKRTIELERTKTGGRVVVPVPKRAAKVLPWTGTVGANEASALFGRLCRELLIEGLVFHDARASALTWLAGRMDILTLSRISRHKDLRILAQVYYRESAASIAARL